MRRGSGDRTRVRPGARPARRGCRATRAPRRGGHRARVDGASGHHRASVNVYFHTFGCKANQYDTARVEQAFADQGATVVEDPAAADVAVVNSCTVTRESEAKLRRFVRRLARQGERLETVVMGCAAARDRGAIAALPRVRAVVGGADPAQVVRAAGLAMPANVGAQHAAPLHRDGVRTRALLKIQDGCDEHCTFCATTLARGANRSRAIPELVQEARVLAEHHAEIVLTGVHIGTYGQDREAGNGKRETSSLGELLEALIAAVPAVRFRLSSIEATEVDDTIARFLIEAPRHLAAHLHAPLQSGSNRVLKRMGRHWYTAETYRARLEWLAARLPVLGLGADIIAGFPGETDDDHAATMALVAALPFTYLHVFPYSERPAAADVVLVNTCAVRDHAEQKVLSRVGELKRCKRPGGVLGVVGCMAQRLGPKLLERIPQVDLVVGPDGYRGLPELIARVRAGGGERAADVEFRGWEHYEDVPPAREAGASAFVTVQRGCDYRCTFCIVPMTRGPERSRKLADVVREVERLAGAGTTEVTLLGQTVNSYDDGTHDFADLLRAVGAVSGIRRMRFTSPYPTDFGERVVAAMAETPAVCEHVHLPVQSGSSRVLRRMLRRYDRDRYLAVVAALRDAMPGIALTTDILVGFPGESEEDFRETLSLVEAVAFDDAFTFRYSPRAGTPATRLKDVVPDPVAGERLERLVAAVRGIARRKNVALVGSTHEVLVEGWAKRGDLLQARTRANKVALFPGPDPWLGSYRMVRFTGTTGSTFAARTVGQEVAVVG